VAGHPVNPIEWWDPHWVADRVDRKLVEAGVMSAAEATKAPVAKPPAKKKAAAKRPPAKKKSPPRSQTIPRKR
jgi:hypothetical protein